MAQDLAWLHILCTVCTRHFPIAAMAERGWDSLAYDLLLLKASPGKDKDLSTSNVWLSDLDDSSVCSLMGKASVTDASTAESDGTERVAPIVPLRSAVVFLRHVSARGSHSDSRMLDLIGQTRCLSEIVFHEDCLEEITKKSNWKLTLLASEDLSTLCGFLVWKIVNGSLSIAKLAVPFEFRGSGFGRLIMEDAIKSAKKQGDVYEVCLSSLPTAVTFYQRLGFKAFKSFKIKTDRDLVEDQVYMEKKLRPRRK